MAERNIVAVKMEEIQPTSLVNINPEADSQVIAFCNEALGLQKYAEARIIKTVEDLKPATDDLSIIAKVRKGMEERRKEYLKPLDDHRKAINDTFKMLMLPIETADQLTRKKILAFQGEQSRIRREQEEINRLRLEAAAKEAILNGKPIEPVEIIPLAQETPRKTTTEMGSASAFKVRKWEIIDFQLVPDDLKVIDAGKVTKLVKAGIGSISGLRIWEEDSLRVNTR